MKANTLQAFELKKGADIADGKIETMDSFDNLFCYGDPKGTVYVNQINTDGSEFVVQQVSNLKVISSYSF